MLLSFNLYDGCKWLFYLKWEVIPTLEMVHSYWVNASPIHAQTYLHLYILISLAVCAVARGTHILPSAAPWFFPLWLLHFW